MKKRASFFVIIMLLTMFGNDAFAVRNKKFRRSEIGVKTGVSLGFPFGRIIPKGATGLPMPAPSLGVSYSYNFSPRWSAKIGIDYYWMKARFETPYNNIIYKGDVLIENPDGSTTLMENAEVNIDYALVKDGLFDNRYVSIPLLASYHMKKGWSVQFGPYVAYKLQSNMTGKATDVVLGGGNLLADDFVDFDESNQFKQFDFGLNVGGNYELKSGINFNLNLVAGVVDIFKKEFTAPPGPYSNMVLQAGIGYRIGGSRRL